MESQPDLRRDRRPPADQRYRASYIIIEGRSSSSFLNRSGPGFIHPFFFISGLCALLWLFVSVSFFFFIFIQLCLLLLFLRVRFFFFTGSRCNASGDVKSSKKRERERRRRRWYSGYLREQFTTNRPLSFSSSSSFFFVLLLKLLYGCRAQKVSFFLAGPALSDSQV